MRMSRTARAAVRSVCSVWVGDRLAAQGKRIAAGALESAHRDHYKSGAHKHRARNGHRYFKRGQAYPVITHGSALDGLRPCENNDQIWEPSGSFGLVRSDMFVATKPRIANPL